jgi:hypothetical protein
MDNVPKPWLNVIYGDGSIPASIRAWRDGIAPTLSTAGLKALQKAVDEDDSRLIQGVTTSPPPLQCVQDWPVESACAVAFAGWQGDGLNTVGEVEDFFARVCHIADTRLGEPAAVRHFLNVYDSLDRDMMRKVLLVEVELELAKRRQSDAT